ncbi:MAG: hypothetical protein HYS87_00915 [Candidatus Colwellbacteria bacterium]|nr:hypothetical protein [Candidatus Colwellbacteria bacterium]
MVFVVKITKELEVREVVLTGDGLRKIIFQSQDIPGELNLPNGIEFSEEFIMVSQHFFSQRAKIPTEFFPERHTLVCTLDSSVLMMKEARNPEDVVLTLIALEIDDERHPILLMSADQSHDHMGLRFAGQKTRLSNFVWSLTPDEEKIIRRNFPTNGKFKLQLSLKKEIIETESPLAN